MTKEPTYTELGTKTYTCTVEGCIETKTEEIPKLVQTVAKDILESMLQLSQTSFTYNQNSQQPSVTVKDGGLVLKQGTDYTVSCLTDDIKNVGTKILQVTGTGNYQGSVNITYQIAPLDLNSVVIKDISSQAFQKGGCTPAVEIYDGEVELAAGTDYTVVYEQNTKPASTAVVSIHGIGNYTGDATKQFAIQACNHTGGAATCQIQAVCDICGQRYGAYGAHVFSAEWTTDKEPTTAAAGIKSHHCTVPGCTATTDETVLSAIVTVHTHTEGSWRTDTEATCTREGSRSLLCSTCGQVIRTEAIPATGQHTWSDGTVKQGATALAEGTEIRTCSICGQSETRQTAKLDPYIRVTSSAIKLKTSQSTQAVRVTGKQTGDKVVSWKSSNTKIVKVNSSGKITAQKKTGIAYITVKLQSGKSAKIKVTVQKAAVATTKITGVPAKVNLKVKKTLQLKPVLDPITSVEKITYTTSNNKVATVTAKGKITAKKAGTAKISVKAGKKKYVVTVTVKK